MSSLWPPLNTAWSPRLLRFPVRIPGCARGAIWAVSVLFFACRYNNYDRAVINTVTYDVVHRWYAAHRTLTTELRRPENELWVKLKPGKVGLGAGRLAWVLCREGSMVLWMCLLPLR